MSGVDPISRRPVTAPVPPEVTEERQPAPAEQPQQPNPQRIADTLEDPSVTAARASQRSLLGVAPATGDSGAIDRGAGAVRTAQQQLLPSLVPTPSMLGRVVPDPGRGIEAGLNVGAASGAISAQTAPVSQQPGQDPRVNVQVQTELALGGTFGVPFAAGIEGSLGGRITTQLDLSPGDFAAMRSGARPFPDLNDPRTLPEGATATLQSEFTTNTGGRMITPRAPTGSVRFESTSALGSQLQLQRTGDQVTVTGGRTLSNEERTTVGLRVLPAMPGLPLVAETQLRQSSIGETRTFDVSNEQGRQDYQAYLRAQLTPPRTNDGAPNPVTRLELQQRGAISTPRFLPVATSWELTRSEASFQVNPDGSTELQARHNDVTMSTRTDAQGQRETWLRFNGVNPRDQLQYRNLFGLTRADRRGPGMPGQTGVEVSFNQEQLGQLQQLIRDTYPAQRLEQMQPGQERRLMEQVLAARTPEDAARAMLFARPGLVLKTFGMLGAATAFQRPIPGSIR